MPLLRINATADGIVLHGTPQPAARRLCALATRPGPAIIMIHGYKYAPGTAKHCPHRKIFGTAPHSWPDQLGFDTDRPGSGLGIALGWHARGSLRAMHRRAADLGESVAVIVALLRHHTPDRPVHIIAHSLGSEAALSALEHLPRGSVDRMILLTGASRAGRAARLLDTPAGRSAEVLNVTSRENDLFDAAFERLVPSGDACDHTIGGGIAAPNVATLQLDCKRGIGAMGDLGFAIGPSDRRICHWSSYERPGVMALYSRFLRAPEKLPLATLIDRLPATPQPRWSRLFTRRTHAGNAALPPGPHAVGSASPLTRSGPNEPAY